MNGEREEHENVCVCSCMRAPHCAPACLHMFSCVYSVCLCTFRSYANNIKGSCTAGITKNTEGQRGRRSLSPSARLAESSNKTECAGSGCVCLHWIRSVRG